MKRQKIAASSEFEKTHPLQVVTTATKNIATFHYTGWLIGILIMAYNKP